MSEQDLSQRGARPYNRKVETPIAGMIVGMTVYRCGDRCSKAVGIKIVKITEANYRDNPDLCLKIVVESLLSLPSGFYTVVNHTKPVPSVMDFRVVNKGYRLRVRPFDGEMVNSMKQPACLRVVVQ